MSISTPPSPRLQRVDVRAPQSFLAVGKPYNSFLALRALVLAGAGFDFLATCGDIFRSRGFHSQKSGVAERSWHKTGRAFDYNQEDKALVVVPERNEGQQYFRTYLQLREAAVTDRTFVVQVLERQLRTMSGAYVAPGFYFDFTKAAASVGYFRIPAWRGWERNWNGREFWHYQCDEQLSWDEAMRFIYDLSAPVAEKREGVNIGGKLGEQVAPFPVVPEGEQRVMGRNDRGSMVRDLQAALCELGLLSRSDVDGVFGVATFGAVMEAQRRHNRAHREARIDVDGTVGPVTRAAIREQIAALRAVPKAA
jgi:Putative peptidoglycan binding domain